MSPRYVIDGVLRALRTLIYDDARGRRIRKALSKYSSYADQSIRAPHTGGFPLRAFRIFSMASVAPFSMSPIERT